MKNKTEQVNTRRAPARHEVNRLRISSTHERVHMSLQPEPQLHGQVPARVVPPCNGLPGIITHGVIGRAGYDAPRFKVQADQQLIAGYFRLTEATAGPNRNAIHTRSVLRDA